MRTPHLSVRQGQRVSVKLRTGEVYVGKFYEKRSGKIFLYDMGAPPFNEIALLTKEIRSFKIVKGNP